MADLSAFASRNAPQPVPPPPPRRHRLIAVAVLPLALIGLFLWAGFDHWRPAVPVHVVRVTTISSSGQDRGPGPAFQAAGWIEADPLPIRVTALVSGVIASVAVVEGQAVHAGDVLATLDDADFISARDLAAAQLAAAEATVAENDHQY
ncbi:MAG: biotin/lipoyl-binding protein, partial [Planctomycetota bacterium]